MLKLNMEGRGSGDECGQLRSKYRRTCTWMQTVQMTLHCLCQWFQSPQVLAGSPLIHNWLLCSQLTRQQPGNWQPSGAVGDPGSPYSNSDEQQSSGGKWKHKLGCNT